MTGQRTVIVVGGGITGLSAAHELVERGFDVRVVECRTTASSTGQPELELGGLARTQYGYIPSPPTRQQLDLAASARAPMRATDHLPDGITTVLSFRARSAELTAASHDRLQSLSARLAGPLERYGIRLSAGTPADAASEVVPRLRAERLDSVRRALRVAGVDESRIATLELGEVRDEVELRLCAALAPGEHGFRFFPACYRHVHDLLRRIPLYDERGQATQRTLSDRLRPVESQWLARQRASSVELSRARGGSLLGMSAWVSELGYSPRDAALIFLRLLRFATSCVARRIQQCEDITFWDYCTLRHLDAPGDSSGNAPERLPYTPSFAEYLEQLPRALVAMDARHADALTQAGTYLQLTRDQLLPGPPIDAVLDAPTTLAWFIPWRQHLECMGVRFHSGRLVSLDVEHDAGTPRLVPRFEATIEGGLDGFEPSADYYLLALDLVGAQRVTRSVADWGARTGVDVGVFADVQRFALEQPPGPAGAPERRRDPLSQCGEHPWDRLQTLTGIQYFCGHRTTLATGFGYFLDSEWALTSVTPTEHWRGRCSLQRDGFLSLISVDIGDVRTPSRVTGCSAATSTADQLAAEVWRQIRQAASGGGVSAMPTPLYYHLDENLEFGPDGLVRNHAPYLINVAGDWRRRPGPEPFNPHQRGGARGDRVGGVIWQAPHGGYWLHFGQVVFGGTYLRTFTRLTTMESANESARHAVNAILDHAASAAGIERGAPIELPRCAAVPSGVGDYCPVWSWERYEFAELDFLKDVDAELLGRGLPHLWDILELDELPLRLPEPTNDPMLDVLHLVADRLEEQLGSNDATSSDALARLLVLIREGLAAGPWERSSPRAG